MAKQSFDQWFAKVNAVVNKKIGLDVNDLPDQPFYDWYLDGVSPSTAASRAIKGANE